MSARAVGLTGWCVLALAAVTLELLGREQRAGVTTFGIVLTRIVRVRFGRVALLGAWLALGWHLFLAPPGG